MQRLWKRFINFVAIIKHPPLLALSDLTKRNAIFVSSSTPFMSAFKRSLKLIDKIEAIGSKKSNFIRIIGLGKAIDKALKVGLKLQTQGYKLEIITSTKHALDENQDEASDSTSLQTAVLQKRCISCVEIKVFGQRY